MHQDIDELWAFYDGRIGSHVRRLLARQIRERWANVGGMTVMGLGYATPYLGQFRGEAARLGALMPAEQGVRAWPANGPIRSMLVEEDMLPLPDACVDRLLAVHAIEMSDSVKRTLREIWRVLKPEGRALIVVPNRRSIWARGDSTPFGQGQPFSRGQLEQLITNSMFAIEHCGFALAPPPVEFKLVWRYAPALERLGLKMWPHFSGAILLEASKQVSATIPKGRLMPVRAGLRHVAAAPAAQWGRGKIALPAARIAGEQEHGLRADEVLHDGWHAEPDALPMPIERH
jgi:SAM-dependent methyltransferase